MAYRIPTRALCHGLLLGLASRGIPKSMVDLARLRDRITRPTRWQAGNLNWAASFCPKASQSHHSLESTEYGQNTVWGQHPPQFPYPYNVPAKRIGCTGREHPSNLFTRPPDSCPCSCRCTADSVNRRRRLTVRRSFALVRCPVNLNPPRLLVSEAPLLPICHTVLRSLGLRMWTPIRW